MPVHNDLPKTNTQPVQQQQNRVTPYVLGKQRKRKKQKSCTGKNLLNMTVTLWEARCRVKLKKVGQSGNYSMACDITS